MNSTAHAERLASPVQDAIRRSIRRRPMIKPKCDKCKRELTQYGALAFSPPREQQDGNYERDVEKFHICAKCSRGFLEWIES